MKIKASIINAFIISRAFGCNFYYDTPDKTPKEGINVMGGFYDEKYKPGNTTDVTAAIAAVAVGSKLLFNISKERGVYDKDPERHPDAKLLKRLSFDELISKSSKLRKPGMNFIFDPRAAKICKAKGIHVLVTNDLEDIRRLLNNKKVNGTILS